MCPLPSKSKWSNAFRMFSSRKNNVWKIRRERASSGRSECFDDGQSLPPIFRLLAKAMDSEGRQWKAAAFRAQKSRFEGRPGRIYERCFPFNVSVTEGTAHRDSIGLVGLVTGSLGRRANEGTTYMTAEGTKNARKESSSWLATRWARYGLGTAWVWPGHGLG